MMTFGIPQQRLGNADPLFVSFGKRVDAAVAHVLNLGLLHDSLDLPGELFAPQTLGLTDKPQVLRRRFVHIQWGLFRQIADEALA